MPRSKNRELPDSINIKTEIIEKDKVKDKLLAFYGQWVESGHPEHIITRNEVAQIFGLANTKLVTNYLQKRFNHTNLDFVLQSMGLPHNPLRRDSEW